MKKEHWGTTIWRYLHTLVENISEKKFQENRVNIINLINYIGLNLPCGACSYHYYKENIINTETVFHKDGLIFELWKNHNNINKSRNINSYDINVLDQYNEYEYEYVEKDFFEVANYYKKIDINKVKSYLTNIFD